MKELYRELLGREVYLKSEEQTESNLIRLSELSLTIIRVQQLLLEEISNG